MNNHEVAADIEGAFIHRFPDIRLTMEQSEWLVDEIEKRLNYAECYGKKWVLEVFYGTVERVRSEIRKGGSL